MMTFWAMLHILDHQRMSSKLQPSTIFGCFKYFSAFDQSFVHLSSSRPGSCWRYEFRRPSQLWEFTW